MGNPVPTAVGVVEHERLHVVHRSREARLGRLVRLELLPKGSQVGGLVIGEQAEDALGGVGLTLHMGRLGGGIVGVGVASINLDDVMDKAHDHGTGDVDGLVRVLPQQIGHHRRVPSVLCVVLSARVASDVRLAQDLLLPVYLENEVSLPLKALSVHEIPSDVHPAILPGNVLMPLSRFPWLEPPLRQLRALETTMSQAHAATRRRNPCLPLSLP